jgi:hypothetical protein
MKTVYLIIGISNNHLTPLEVHENETRAIDTMNALNAEKTDDKDMFIIKPMKLIN